MRVSYLNENWPYLLKSLNKIYFPKQMLKKSSHVSHPVCMFSGTTSFNCSGDNQDLNFVIMWYCFEHMTLNALGLLWKFYLSGDWGWCRGAKHRSLFCKVHSWIEHVEKSVPAMGLYLWQVQPDMPIWILILNSFIWSLWYVSQFGCNFTCFYGFWQIIHFDHCLSHKDHPKIQNKRKARQNF